MPKYKLNLSELDKHANVHKLERDGFTREKIIDAMYKQTDGASTQEREQMVRKLYDRQRGE